MFFSPFEISGIIKAEKVFTKKISEHWHEYKFYGTNFDGEQFTTGK